MIDPAGFAHLAAARADAAGEDRAAALRAIRPLLRDLDWLGALSRHALGAMAADPVHLPPFAASRHGAIGHLALARAGRVTVGVTLLSGAAARYEPDMAPAAPQLSFSGQWTLTRLLSADPLVGRRARLTDEGTLGRIRPVRLRPGAVLALDEAHQALWMAPPERAAALLRVRIMPVHPRPVRAFDLTTGRPLASVQGDEAMARTLMLMSVLRALGADDAVPLFARIVNDAGGPARWAAMREWLALDAVSAWPRLLVMSEHDGDPAVRKAALATLVRFAPAQAA